MRRVQASVFAAAAAALLVIAVGGITRASAATAPGRSGSASGSVAVCAVAPGNDACPTWFATYDYPPGDGTGEGVNNNGRDTLQGEAISPVGDRVYVTGASDDAGGTFQGETGTTKIATVAYDSATGAQLWTARYSGPDAHDNLPRAIAVSPDGRTVFVAGLQDEDVINNYELVAKYVTLAYDAQSGALVWSAAYSAPGPYPTLCCGLQHTQFSQAAGIAVSPDGSKVAVTGQSGQSPGDGNNTAFTTVVYDARTGAQVWSDRIDDPANWTDSGIADEFTPDGSALVATGHTFIQDAGGNHYEYRTVAYDASSGVQRWSVGYDFGNGNPNFGKFVQISPDGSRVFVGGQINIVFGNPQTSEYGVVAFDATTGSRLWTATYAGPNAGYANPYAMALSPDGRTLVVTGDSPNALSGQPFGGVASQYGTVALNATTGQQLWAQLYQPAGDTYDTAQAVAITPDGLDAIVTGTAATTPEGPGVVATITYSLLDGSTVHTDRFPGPTGESEGYAVQATPDDGAIVGGVFLRADPTDGGDYGVFRYAGSQPETAVPDIPLPPVAPLAGLAILAARAVRKRRRLAPRATTAAASTNSPGAHGASGICAVGIAASLGSNPPPWQDSPVRATR